MQDKICMVGLGYVGLPLAVAFAGKMPVVGFDVDALRIKELQAGHDRTLEVSDEELALVRSQLAYTVDIQNASGCNVDVYDPSVDVEAEQKWYRISRMRVCESNS